MRVMVMVKATRDSEAGVMPAEKMLADMGRFNEELVAGFWLWQVRSMDEAVEWARRCPNPHPQDCELEIRPVFEADDFGAAFTPELREQEERLRAAVEKNA